VRGTTDDEKNSSTRLECKVLTEQSKPLYHDNCEQFPTFNGRIVNTTAQWCEHYEGHKIYDECIALRTTSLKTSALCCLTTGFRYSLDIRLVSLRHARLPLLLRDGLRLDVKIVSLRHACFHLSLRDGLRLDVRLVSFRHMCFHLSLRDGLRLAVRLVSLRHACFHLSLRDGLRLDVRLVSLRHECFHISLRNRLRLDVRLVSFRHMFPSLLTRRA